MKSILTLLLFGIITSATAQETLFETMSFQQAVDNGTRTRTGQPGPNYWQNHADYDISVRLDTGAKKIFGSETITYYNESPDTLTQIVMRLYTNKFQKGAVRNISMATQNIHDGVSLDTLALNGKGHDLSNIQTRGTNLAIPLMEPLPPGGQVEVYCTWETPIPTAPDFRRFGYYQQNGWFIGYFYPQIAVYDDMETYFNQKGWDYLLFHQGMQEFYNDFNNYKVTIQVPDNFQVWATGTLQNEQEVYSQDFLKKLTAARESENPTVLLDSTQETGYLTGNTWKFEASEVPDFAFGTAPGYQWEGANVKVDGRDVFVQVAFPPGSGLYDQSLDIAIKSVKYASETYPAIPYPYDHHTSFNGMWGGGMEFPMIANNDASTNPAFFKTMTHHEIFHNYAPFMLGMNEKRYPFMDEGFTQYFTDHYVQNAHSTPSVFNKYLYYGLFAKNDDFPLIYSFSQVNDLNTTYYYYIKPNLAYELFANMVGEDNFKKVFQGFTDRWKGKHPTPWDFFNTANDILGANYNWFWKSWFFDLSYADLGLRFDEKQLIVERVNDGLPVPVYLNVQYSDGSTDTIYRSMAEWSDGKDQLSITLDKEKEIQSITLDKSRVPDVNPANDSVSLN